MKIYIAGPYTKGDVAQNVRNACLMGDEILKRGHIPFVPHLTHLWHLISPHPWETWLKIDCAFLKDCDAVFRIPGESVGADREVAQAIVYGLPIYYSLDEIPNLVCV